jgi:16S rRNA (guanine1207-N2)-methyltransferase
LDEGTAFLIRHIPSDIRGAVLDFGCGSGALGATIKSLNPGCEVSLVDSNAFAVVSAQRTFSANGLTPREIRPVDGLDGVGDGRFDMIVSNPPFHQGVGTDYNVVARFLQSCERHLHPDGVVLMVANRFLPYERMMPKSLQLSLVAEDTKYKVLKGRLATR